MPTFPHANQFSSFVLPGGRITLRATFETWAGSGTGQPVASPQITITPADGGAAVAGPVTPAASDLTSYTYEWFPPAATPPGDYVATWTGTGTSGPLTLTETVTVVPFPATVPAPGVYATYGQYQEWSMDTLTPQTRVAPALRRATEVIDLYLIGAVYTTDGDGMPTQAPVINAIMRATCAQAQFMLANNDPANIKSQYASTSMGGVTQVRTASAQGQVLPPLAPHAAAILQEAGFLGTAPLVNW